MIVKPKKKGKDVFSNLAGLKFSYNSSHLSPLLLLHLLSEGFETVRKKEGKKEGGEGWTGNPLLRQTLSAVPNAEIDRGAKEITSTSQTRC